MGNCRRYIPFTFQQRSYFTSNVSNIIASSMLTWSRFLSEEKARQANQFFFSHVFYSYFFHYFTFTVVSVAFMSWNLSETNDIVNNISLHSHTHTTTKDTKKIFRESFQFSNATFFSYPTCFIIAYYFFSSVFDIATSCECVLLLRVAQVKLLFHFCVWLYKFFIWKLLKTLFIYKHFSIIWTFRVDKSDDVN